MRTRLFLALLLLALLSFGPGSVTRGLAQGPDGADFLPGVVVVGLRPAKLAEGRRALQAAAASAASPAPAVARLHAYRLRVPPGQELAVAKSLRGQEGIAYAEPAYLAHAQGDPVIPNDPDWARQWGPAKIGAPQAWSFVTGSPDVTIALLDSGVDLSHPDLAGRLWTNPGEIPGNGIDDDGNGQVDDVHGWHFFHSWNSGDPVPQEDALLQDDFGHGTHVAGIAGAAGGNGIGIAGLSWRSPLMPVKVLDSSGNGLYTEIASGIVYAADNGARVINLSVGGAGFSQLLCDAADYARSKGSLLVAAAGNSGGPVLYPAACPGVLAVAATDAQDQRPAFSNFGPEVSLAAPGVDIWSTWFYSGTRISGYESETGTSMATPHVSGLAALVWSRWPQLSSAAVVMQMAQAAVDVAQPGWDPQTGWGRIDAGRAVAAQAAPSVDLWAQVQSPPGTASIQPGRPITYQVTYGNRGWLPATGVHLTATLPAALAAAASTAAIPATIPARSGPYTAVITCTASSVATAPAARFALGSAERELTPDDNVARFGGSVFLPSLPLGAHP